MVRGNKRALWDLGLAARDDACAKERVAGAMATDAGAVLLPRDDVSFLTGSRS